MNAHATQEAPAAVTTEDATSTNASVAITHGGERLELLAGRAVLWPARRTLFVADVHLGKPASFRDGGAPVPEAVTDADLARLSTLIDHADATDLVVLGDLVHDRIAWRERTLSALSAWRAERPGLAITLVRGNHDRRAADPPPVLEIETVDPGHPLGPFALHHEPVETESPALCGHIHPAVVLKGRRKGASVRTPCFWLARTTLVLPAFGSFTGCAAVRPGPDDRVFAVAPGSVIECPVASRERRRTPVRAGTQSTRGAGEADG